MAGSGLSLVLWDEDEPEVFARGDDVEAEESKAPGTIGLDVSCVVEFISPWSFVVMVVIPSDSA